MFHDKSNHIEIKYHYIWDMVQRGFLNIEYIPIEEHVIDVIIKPLSHVKFEHFQDMLGVV